MTPRTSRTGRRRARRTDGPPAIRARGATARRPGPRGNFTGGDRTRVSSATATIAATSASAAASSDGRPRCPLDDTCERRRRSMPAPRAGDRFVHRLGHDRSVGRPGVIRCGTLDVGTPSLIPRPLQRLDGVEQARSSANRDAARASVALSCPTARLPLRFEAGGALVGLDRSGPRRSGAAFVRGRRWPLAAPASRSAAASSSRSLATVSSSWATRRNAELSSRAAASRSVPRSRPAPAAPARPPTRRAGGGRAPTPDPAPRGRRCRRRGNERRRRGRGRRGPSTAPVAADG